MGESRKPGTPEYFLIRYRILLVDEEPMGRALLEAILQTETRYDVFVAPESCDILQVAEERSIDLILMDTRLCEKDGYQMCRALKTHSPTQWIPIILLTGQASAAERGKGLEAGAEDVIGRPFHRAELLLRVRSLLRIKALHDQLDEVEQAILALSRLIEARDQYTEAHTERVAAYAEGIGREIGLREEDLRMLYRAALLHDIGKVGIPELVLNKPGMLTVEETRLMRESTILSPDLCAPLRATPQLLPIIRHLHERVDGTGYPDHLSGDQIPLGARILSIADAYDAMTSQRPYRPALSPAKARAQLKAGAGHQWDARLVDVFLTWLIKGDRTERPAVAA